VEYNKVRNEYIHQQHTNSTYESTNTHVRDTMEYDSFTIIKNDVNASNGTGG
jgi:hypothetical protein